MKKLLLALMLLSTITYSQDKGYAYASIGVDAKNAIVGSEPTNNQSALDIPIFIGLVDKSGFGGGVGIETFSKIGYFSWNVRASKEFKILNDKVSIIPSIEYVQITRKYDVSYPTIITLNDVTENPDGSITDYWYNPKEGEVYPKDQWENRYGTYIGTDIYGHQPEIQTTEKYHYHSYGANLETNYNFNDIHSLGVRLNWLRRTDLEDKYPENGSFQYRYSVYVTYTFKIPLK